MHAAGRPAGGMEDDDEISTLLLYCDEDPFLDSTTSTAPPPPATTTASPSVIPAAGRSYGNSQLLLGDDDGEVAGLVVEFRAREKLYAPAVRPVAGYDDVDLDDQDGGGVSGARSRAVHYIIYAIGRLGLAAATAFNAVNYLDRFLSINYHLRWEVWMVEVVSVACLSVACKLDEVNIPSLHNLQLEEAMSHSFRSSTIRDMELTLLKALQWRLSCVTPYSYLDLLPGSAAQASTSRCTRLLLRSLSEPSFLRFDASVVAAAALRCSSTLQDHHAHLVRPLFSQVDDECFEMMRALDTSLDLDHHHRKLGERQQWSPISVIPFLQTDGSVDSSTVNGRPSAVRQSLFGGRPATPPPPDGAQDEDIINKLNHIHKRCRNN